MIKKIVLLILFMAVFIQATFAQEIFKITSVNFDTSNSLMFLTSPDNSVEPIVKNIKLVKMTKPNRAYFDIDSAVLTAPAQNWFFNSGYLKQVKVGQFSTNPNKIRVVMYFEEGFNPQKISFLKINNNLVVKFKDGICKNAYFQHTYSDEFTPSDNFYEKTAITSEDVSKVQIAVNTKGQDAVLNQIQQAFNSSIAPECTVKPTAVKSSEVIKKDLKLSSKYYLEQISIKKEGVLLSGFGDVSVKKPMYLAAPARVIFDLPNTILNPDLRNKEFKINEKESVKLGQFDQKTARIVITSESLEKYVTVFSSDKQSLLLANQDKVTVDSLCSKATDAVAYYYRDVNPKTDELIIAFNAPVVHSVKRDASKLTVYFYNALRYNDQTFRNTLKSTSLKDMNIYLMPNIGLKLTMPLKKDNTVNCDLGSDAKSLKITIIGPKALVEKPEQVQTKTIKLKGKGVVLDPGHGGVDYGAIRSGINEKDINLDIAKRVEAILKSKGIPVEMTRYQDETVSLQDRTIFTANNNPEIFVSIHVNSSTGTSAKGIETHYYHPESVCLAQTVHSSLASCVKTADRGLFKSKFYVINHTEVPAVLVEIGFISNDAERAELVSEKRKQQTAKAIADGVIKYLKEN